MKLLLGKQRNPDKNSVTTTAKSNDFVCLKQVNVTVCLLVVAQSLRFSLVYIQII